MEKWSRELVGVSGGLDIKVLLEHGFFPIGKRFVYKEVVLSFTESIVLGDFKLINYIHNVMSQFNLIIHIPSSKASIFL